jgi:hypothetical protein
MAADGGFPAVRRFGFSLTVLVLVVIGLVAPRCHCFTALNMHRNHVVISGVHLLQESTSSSSSDGMASSSADDVIARRITVVGDVGGYYRACVINEVRMEDALFFLFFSL